MINLIYTIITTHQFKEPNTTKHQNDKIDFEFLAFLSYSDSESNIRTLLIEIIQLFNEIIKHLNPEVSETNPFECELITKSAPSVSDNEDVITVLWPHANANSKGLTPPRNKTIHLFKLKNANHYPIQNKGDLRLFILSIFRIPKLNDNKSKDLHLLIKDIPHPAVILLGMLFAHYKWKLHVYEYGKKEMDDNDNTIGIHDILSLPFSQNSKA